MARSRSCPRRRARATANARGDPRRRRATSPTASSSSSSGRRAAASRRCCAWWRGSRRSPAARSRSATASSTTLEPKDRDIAMVFQNYALYPHMSVFDNMAYGLQDPRLREGRHRGARASARPRSSSSGRCSSASRAQLSGGQRQRVAMGRAIVREPAVFLFDEPLSNLDAKLRVQMRFEIQKLHRRLRTTSLYVTHDQVEAMTLAHRMIVMNAGRAEQIGTPMEVYENPATLFVAGFIGSPAMNFLPGKARGGGTHRARARRQRARTRTCGAEAGTRGHRRHPSRAPASVRRRRDAMLRGPGRDGRAARRRHAGPRRRTARTRVIARLPHGPRTGASARRCTFDAPIRRASSCSTPRRGSAACE